MIRVIKRIFDVMFILIIILLGVYLVLKLYNKVEIYNVETGSMEYNIHIGDYILILEKDDYHVGDIVTFKKSDYVVTHRIIKKDNDIFITKGDANNVEDDAISRSSIIGKVILIGGILNIVINYRFAIIALFLSLYLLSCYFDKDRKEKGNNQE